MAITPLTGFKSFTFGDVVSTDYGVQILGEGVFNAPERVVEMIEIPGRNGKFALDMGRFENIEVTYPATLIADNVTDFAEALSDLRNALCSKKGYMRLEDDYHPDEYRMAVYKEGLEVDEEVLRVGKFNIKFDCKPQRFLTSGETAVSVDSGDTLTNPTLFEASPLLEIEGYGTLNVNGTEIELADELVGMVRIYPPRSNVPYSISFLEVYINTNDTLTVYGADVSIGYQTKSASNIITSVSVNSWSGDASSSPTISMVHDHSFLLTIGFDSPLTFSYGTPSTKTVTVAIRYSTSDYGTKTISNINVSLSYDGEKTFTLDTNANADSVLSVLYKNADTSEISINSTATTYGHPTYIDCDLGEAYAVDDGVISSLNSYIALGSKLPKLSVGESEITFDNTFTEVKITPRWWKI